VVVLLESQFIDARRQSSLVTGRRVAVQNAFLHRFVDYRNGFGMQRARIVEAACGERGERSDDRAFPLIYDSA
jgi:hypothetical protein